MDQKFVRAQQEFARLKARFDAGTLSGEDFETALRGLTFEHGGRQWTIGASSGKWFASSGDSWVEATPPGAGLSMPERAPPAPVHPVPPHPVSPAATMSVAMRNMLGRWGAVLLFVGAGSFVLPLIGMQFQLLNLFGEENQQPVAIIFMIVGGIMLFIARSSGNAAATAQTATSPAATPAAAQPTRNHFLIGAAVIGALVLLWYIGSSRGSAPSYSETPSAPSPVQTSSTPAPLPPCGPNYTPPEPQLGSSTTQQTCDPSAQSSPPP